MGVHALTTVGNAAGTRPAIFLDRDGVLNRTIIRDGMPYAPASLDELDIPVDAPPSLDRLKRAGFALVVVTNQPDVARGTLTRAMVEAINGAIGEKMPIDEFRVCYHDDADDCPCRKPRPGMLLQAPVYDVARSFMVGDRWRDIQAGKSAGVSATILMASGHTEPSPIEPDFRATSLAQAVDWIIGRTTRSAGLQPCP
jgi:D-glycero-D-manno-heptose 1,7-bisphosphate phosphatase